MKKNNNLFCFIKKDLSQPHSNQEEQTNEGDTRLYHSRPNRHGRAVGMAWPEGGVSLLFRCQIKQTEFRNNEKINHIRYRHF